MMHCFKTTLIALLFHISNLGAQDTLLFDPLFNRLPAGTTDFSYYEIHKKNANDPRILMVVTLDSVHHLISQERFSDYDKVIKNGKCRYWYDNNQICREITYKQNKKDGVELVYYTNGQLKRQLVWVEDSLQGGSFFEEDGSKRTGIYETELEGAETGHLGRFGNSDKALEDFVKANLIYPIEARKNDIEGDVVLSFIVRRDGSISDIEVISSPGEILSKEAIRVVNLMPNWEPSRVAGHPVNVKFTLPIRFRFEEFTPRILKDDPAP